jgi:hypothetical protein
MLLSAEKSRLRLAWEALFLCDELTADSCDDSEDDDDEPQELDS